MTLSAYPASSDENQSCPSFARPGFRVNSEGKAANSYVGGWIRRTLVYSLIIPVQEGYFSASKIHRIRRGNESGRCESVSAGTR